MTISLRRFLLIISLPLLTSCADLGYYLHSARGHFDIINKQQDIHHLLQEEEIPGNLQHQLRRVLEIRDFAFQQLQLPRSDSYSAYADLGRDHALKNLFAAEEFSIRSKQWCYPVVGCAGYRGFFDQQRLDQFVRNLQQENYDIYIARVSAYSTLGWFDDPVLNTFIHWPDYRLAGLIFHELAHQQLYVDGDTQFNESFATAVQQAGVERWLQYQGKTEQLQRYRRHLQNRQQVIGLIQQARQDLDKVYQQQIDEDTKRKRKADRLQQLKQQYQSLAQSFEVKDGFHQWFNRDINNAQLASLSTYHDWVPAFRRLLEQQQQDFQAFYREVAELAELEKPLRDQCLAKLGSVSLTANNDKGC